MKPVLPAIALLFALVSPAFAITPYQEGMRDYRRGQCYRARPDFSDTEKAKLWERGYDAGAKKYGNRNDKHCHPKY